MTAFRLPKMLTSRPGPTSLLARKTVVPMVDLPTSWPGLAINLGGAGEIKVYADVPIDLQVGEAPVVYENVTDLTLRGDISQVRVVRKFVGDIGRVVIYAGYPELGVNFQRESPLDKTPVGLASAGLTWPLNVPNYYSGTLLAIPNATFTMPFEAYYLFNFRIERTVGSIEKVEFWSNEGVPNPVRRFYADAPGSVINRELPFPLRLAQNTKIHFWGSTEVANTTLNCYFDAVLI